MTIWFNFVFGFIVTSVAEPEPPFLAKAGAALKVRLRLRLHLQKINKICQLLYVNQHFLVFTELISISYFSFT